MADYRTKENAVINGGLSADELIALSATVKMPRKLGAALDVYEASRASAYRDGTP